MNIRRLPPALVSTLTVRLFHAHVTTALSAVCLFGLIISLHPGYSDSVFAQVPPVLDPTGRSGEPPDIEKTRPLPQKEFPEPILPPVDQFPEDSQQVTPSLRVMIEAIQVEGSTVFSKEEIAKVTAPYQHRELATEDLEKLRRELTLLYVNNGYVNSGAIIPDQTLQDGILRYQIIEGKLTEIQIEGTKYFLPSYFEQRIARDAGPPLNIRPLKERLQILLQDPRVNRLNTELKPGLHPGEGILGVRVEEASPFHAWVEFNNFQSPTVGAERGLGTLAVDNPFGLGDLFQFTYGRSKGVDPLLDTSYSIPFTPWDTTLLLHYRQNDFDVVSSAFKSLNIESRSQIFKIALRQPIYRTLSNEVAVSLIGEHLRNKNFIGGTGFSFTPGTTSNGESIVSALRFVQEWINRQAEQVLAFRSRLSWGLDVLNATNNRLGKDDPDLHFFSWLGQAQWARRVDSLGIQLLSNFVVQLANDSLFPLEQFALGGRYSVRGYRENQLVRDNAWVFSFETRVPILPTTLGPNFTVHFAPFVDVGRSWNTKFPNPSPKTLASIGAGVRLSFFQRAYANVYWGQQLNHVSDPPPGGNLQDHGLHVQFILNIL